MQRRVTPSPFSAGPRQGPFERKHTSHSCASPAKHKPPPTSSSAPAGCFRAAQRIARVPAASATRHFPLCPRQALSSASQRPRCASPSPLPSPRIRSAFRQRSTTLSQPIAIQPFPSDLAHARRFRAQASAPGVPPHLHSHLRASAALSGSAAPRHRSPSQANPSPLTLPTPGAFERKHTSARTKRSHCDDSLHPLTAHTSIALIALSGIAASRSPLREANIASPCASLPVRAFRCTRSPHLAFAARTRGPALASPKLINHLTANSALSGIAAAHRAPHSHPFASPRFRCVRELLFQADDPRKSALVFHAQTSRFYRRRTDKMAHISTPAAGQRFPGRLPV